MTINNPFQVNRWIFKKSKSGFLDFDFLYDIFTLDVTETKELGILHGSSEIVRIILMIFRSGKDGEERLL